MQDEKKVRSRKKGDAIPWNEQAKENYVKLIEALLCLLNKQEEWTNIKERDVPVLVRWGEKNNELEVTGKEKGEYKGIKLLYLADLAKIECDYDLQPRSNSPEKKKEKVNNFINHLRALKLIKELESQKNQGYWKFIVCLKEGSQFLEISEDKENRAWFEETRSWLENKWKDGKPRKLSDTKSSKLESKNSLIYWGELAPLEVFYGRHQELDKIKKWIRSGYRLIVIQGMVGNGKKTLAQKLSQDLKGQFDHILYCALSGGPTLREILYDLMNHFDYENLSNIIFDENNNLKMIHKFVYEYLRKYRYCLILDQVGSSEGCRWSEEVHSQFFRAVGQIAHEKSCIILIGREMPNIIDNLEGRGKLQLMVLKGLDGAAATKFCRYCGLHGTEEELERLVRVYNGNPMQIRLVSNIIKRTYGGSISNFLTDGTKNFDSIKNLIDPQLDSLSDDRRKILVRLAKEQDPVSLKGLRIDFPTGLTSNLHSLINYGFIEGVTCNEEGLLYTISPIMRIHILSLKL